MPKLATIAEFLGAISFISRTEVKPVLRAGVCEHCAKGQTLGRKTRAPGEKVKSER
jgi:hypothetical protein